MSWPQLLAPLTVVEQVGLVAPLAVVEQLSKTVSFNVAPSAALSSVLTSGRQCSRRSWASGEAMGSGAACGAAAASKRFCIAIGKLADEEGLKSLALVAVEAVELPISTFRRLALLLSGSRSARFAGAGRLSLFQPVAFR